MFRLLALCAAVALLTGCGYVGDPLPPALNIPQPVRDLAAVQRGSSIVVTWTSPALTTEDMSIRQFSGVNLRVGEKQIRVELPQPGSPITIRVPAEEFLGRQIVVTVRLSGSSGRPSPSSNVITLTVGPPLPRPELTATTHPEGVRLQWHPTPEAQYRILRQTPAEPVLTPVGVATAGEYIDRTAKFGNDYSYAVQAFASQNDSEMSTAVRIVPRDEFAPAPPANVTAVAGQKSIELVWDRNKEPDAASYRIYRAVGNNSEFTVLADALEGTAFSDRQTTTGTTYRYQITVADRSGNESERSKTLAVTTP